MDVVIGLMILAAVFTVVIAFLLSLHISFIAEVSFYRDGFNLKVSAILSNAVKLFGWDLKEGGLSFLFKSKAPEGHKKKKKRLNEIFHEIFNPRSILNLKGIRIFKFKVTGKIATRDAAFTALAYGFACSIVAILLPFLDQQKTEIDFYPDFKETQPDFHISCIIKVRIIHIIYLIAEGLSDKYLKGRWHNLWNRILLKN